MNRRATLPLALATCLAATACFGTYSAAPPSAQAMPSPTTPAEALEALTRGNRRFVDGRSEPRDLPAQVAATSSGQRPFAVVLGCIDSRVPPEVVFDQGLGDLFVGRVAGNFVNTDLLGSFEFATAVSGARLIVVLGHTDCGAVRGACDGVQLGNLTHTLANLRPAVDAVELEGDRSSSNPAFVQAVADENVRLTVARMTAASPILEERVEQGELLVVGAMYDLATGEVRFQDP